MDTIRTTISLPVDLHEELRLLSIKKKKSLGDLIEEKFRGKKKKSKKISISEQIKKDFALFDATARSSVKYDAVRAVREDRDRDNA
ncbi:hypothetical protein HY029_04395 [Candidatus Gottesmanbacteria bacterium]|nr:hypothetical protein [Candidatus Gottesmanbacteria bacterium]